MIRIVLLVVAALALLALVVWFCVRRTRLAPKAPVSEGTESRQKPTTGESMAAGSQVSIPGGRIAFPLPLGWKQTQQDGNLLMVACSSPPGCRLSFSVRSLPSGMPAKAFIAETAEKTQAKMYAAGERWYLFGKDDGTHAASGFEGCWWKVAVSNHIVGIFAEVPRTSIVPGALDALARQMADVIESIHER